MYTLTNEYLLLPSHRHSFLNLTDNSLLLLPLTPMHNAASFSTNWPKGMSLLIITQIGTNWSELLVYSDGRRD